MTTYHKAISTGGEHRPRAGGVLMAEQFMYEYIYACREQAKIRGG